VHRDAKCPGGNEGKRRSNGGREEGDTLGLRAAYGERFLEKICRKERNGAPSNSRQHSFREGAYPSTRTIGKKHSEIARGLVSKGGRGGRSSPSEAFSPKVENVFLNLDQLKNKGRRPIRERGEEPFHERRRRAILSEKKGKRNKSFGPSQVEKKRLVLLRSSGRGNLINPEGEEVP